MVKGGVIALATFEALSAILGLGWGWVHALNASSTVTSWITPVDLVAKLVPTISRTLFLDVAHVVGYVLAAIISLVALRRLPVIGLPRTMGISLLAIVLLGPIVQPWYLTWAIALLAITAGPRTTAAIALLSVAVSVLGVVGLGQLAEAFMSLGLLYQLLSVLTLAVSIVTPICGLRREKNSSAIAEFTSRLLLGEAWSSRIA
jgi:hypothetical protein